MKKLVKAIGKKPKLGRKAEAMWMREASSQEIADELAAEGIECDVEKVEELIAALNAKRARMIAEGEVDEEQLKYVAGGWCFAWQSAQGSYGDGSCSRNFNDSDYADLEVCLLEQYCDKWHDDHHVYDAIWG